VAGDEPGNGVGGLAAILPIGCRDVLRRFADGAVLDPSKGC
jgi:hypothetical protein